MYRFIVLFLISALPLSGQNIPPQASLGVFLDQAPPESGAIYSIKSVLPQSTAAAIGIQVGDLLLSLNGQAITQPSTLFNQLKAMKVKDPIRLGISRKGKKMELKGMMKPRIPIAHSEKAEILLKEVPFRKGYIRAIVNKPRGKGPYKTIYFLQGYPCQSINWQSPQNVFVQLINRWVDQGYAVVRVEKPGAGEYVDCQPCAEMTFTDELEGFANGYEQLQQWSFVDQQNIVLYGHSLGGNVAPYLASRYLPKGVITYGTVIRPWEEFLIAMMRYQQPVIGSDYVQNEAELKIARGIVHELFYEGKSVAELQLSNKELHIMQNYLSITPDGQMFNRKLEFWQELNQHNFTEYWSKVKAPTLALYGSADIEAVSYRDAENIAKVVNAYHSGNGTFELIEGADHGLIEVGTQAEGWQLNQSGQYAQAYAKGIHPQFLKVVDQWLGNLANQTVSSPVDPQILEYENASYQLPAYVTNYGTMDVESADLDADGDLDLVLALEGHANLILWNDGQGNFAKHQKLAPVHAPMNAKLTGEDSEDIALADFDQDGDLDILFATEDTGYHELFWNQGNGQFEAATFEFTKTLNANALAVIDLNKDAYPDIIFGNQGSNEVWINLKNGQFELQTARWLSPNTDLTQDLKLVDIDQDGDLDLIEGAEQGGSNLYLQMDGKLVEQEGAFGDLSTYETRKVIIADLNNDGLEDVFFCNVGWNPANNPANKIFINEGKAQFNDVSDQLNSNAATTLDAVIIDFDKNGIAEILTANGWGTPNLQLFSQSGNQFSTEQLQLPKVAGSAAIALLARDFNGDGQMDIYIGHHNEPDALLLSKNKGVK